MLVSLDVWRDVLPDDDRLERDFFFRLLNDRKAALLYYGLSSLDESTRRYVAGDQDLLDRLYRDHAEPFAAFARSLRISDPRSAAEERNQGEEVKVPGGPEAVELWEELLDERVSRPDRFVENLLERDEGRLAQFYDALARLSDPSRRYALGLWIEGDKRLGWGVAACSAR